MEVFMKAYKGTFKKKNGEARQMRFVKLTDIPETIMSSVICCYNRFRESRS